MSIATFSLPVDIPWKRLCVSDDMIDPSVCDRTFPYRWRSSVAVFSYQPPEEQQTYDDMTVSYLKVSCTVTSFQPLPEEVGLKHRRIDSYWNTPLLIDNYTATVSKAYPCYGAVLEVGVAPSAKEVDGQPVLLSQYPYFMDFDPKKREVYELVSQTGENMSRSLDQVSVGKSSTTTGTHEKLDILNGVSVSGNASVLGTGGGGSVSVQGQWGTRDINQQESSDVRTTDQSREQRENYSHTTQLTQMYQQLNSYHLGTNRAVFLILPRPHIIDDQDTPLTFINGPRRLEGLQEFFLVVMRPKKIADICVEAYLETAHVGQVATYSQVVRRDTDTTKTLSLTVQASPNSPKTLKTKSGAIPYTARAGWTIDTGKSGGFAIHTLKQSGTVHCSVSVSDPTHLTLNGSATTSVVVDRDTGTLDDGSGKRGPVNKPGKSTVEGVDGELEANATVYLQQGGQEQTGSASALYITGRGVCCCQDHTPGAFDKRLSESVVWERPLAMALEQSVGFRDRVPAREANRLRAEIGQMMVASIRAVDRYEAGTVGFAETQLVARSVAGLIDTAAHPDNHAVPHIQGLNPDITRKIVERAPGLTRSDLLLMGANEQGDRFGLDAQEVRHLRRALLGLEGPLPAPPDRWNSPGPRPILQMPLLIGLTADEADRALVASGLDTCTVTVIDNDLPINSVVTQDPAAGTEVKADATIRVSTASGRSVRLPDLTGLRLSQALCRLLEAGLQSEPTIEGHAVPEARVAVLEPAAGTLVTPNTPVSLRLRRKAADQ